MRWTVKPLRRSRLTVRLDAVTTTSAWLTSMIAAPETVSAERSMMSRTGETVYIRGPLADAAAGMATSTSTARHSARRSISPPRSVAASIRLVCAARAGGRPRACLASSSPCSRSSFSPLRPPPRTPLRGHPAPRTHGRRRTSTGSARRRELRSNVWFTLRKAELTEAYYPDLGTPSLRSLEFVVAGDGFVDRETDPGVRSRVRALKGLEYTAGHAHLALAAREDVDHRSVAADGPRARALHVVDGRAAARLRAGGPGAG